VPLAIRVGDGATDHHYAPINGNAVLGVRQHHDFASTQILDCEFEFCSQRKVRCHGTWPGNVYVRRRIKVPLSADALEARMSGGSSHVVRTARSNGWGEEHQEESEC